MLQNKYKKIVESIMLQSFLLKSKIVCVDILLKCLNF